MRGSAFVGALPEAPLLRIWAHLKRHQEPVGARVGADRSELRSTKDTRNGTRAHSATTPSWRWSLNATSPSEYGGGGDLVPSQFGGGKFGCGKYGRSKEQESDVEHAKHKGIGGQSRKPLDLAWETWRPNRHAQFPTPNFRPTNLPPPPGPCSSRWTTLMDAHKAPPPPLTCSPPKGRYQQIGCPLTHLSDVAIALQAHQSGSTSVGFPGVGKCSSP